MNIIKELKFIDYEKLLKLKELNNGVSIQEQFFALKHSLFVSSINEQDFALKHLNKINKI